MLASDYVETIVSEMNPRCGNFVSCWLGLWQTYPWPKITGKHCVDRSFITLLYSPSILSIDSEETDCTVWIKSGISRLMLESQHVLFTYSKAEIFRNLTLYSDFSKSNMQVLCCDMSSTTCIMQYASWFFFNLDFDIWTVCIVTCKVSFFINILWNVNMVKVLPVIKVLK